MAIVNLIFTHKILWVDEYLAFLVERVWQGQNFLSDQALFFQISLHVSSSDFFSCALFCSFSRLYYKSPQIYCFLCGLFWIGLFLIDEHCCLFPCPVNLFPQRNKITDKKVALNHTRYTQIYAGAAVKAQLRKGDNFERNYVGRSSVME